MIISTASSECPYCGETVCYQSQLSYTICGKMLDFRPYGMACIPTPVPKCPECGFVFFNDLFSIDEIDKLKEILKFNNIFKTELDMPKYYYLAREFELLKKNIDDIIHYYQCAIWEDSSKGRFIYKDHNTSTLESVYISTENIIQKLFSYYDQIDVNNKNYYIYKLIKIDLLRRISKFDIAVDLIISLKNESNFIKKNMGICWIINYY